MYRTILVPLDGSGLAARALPYAISLAKAAGSRLILAYSPDFWELPLDMPAQLQRGAVEARTVGVDVATHLCTTHGGNHGRAIVDAAHESGAELIVMGTHGHGAVGRMLLGSVADEVLRHAEVPVLLCTPPADQHWPEDRPRRVLLPLDGSTLAEAAIEPARTLAKELGASLLLFAVVELSDLVVLDGYVSLEATTQARLTERGKYLEGVAKQLRGEGLNVAVMAAVGAPDGMIARAAREQRADLIVMATHGRGGAIRLLLGSVAQDTLRRSTVPVMLIPPPGLPEHVLGLAPDQMHLTAPEAAPSDLAISPAERSLLARGLEQLRAASAPEDQTRSAIDRLLTRLAQAEEPV